LALAVLEPLVDPLMVQVLPDQTADILRLALLSKAGEVVVRRADKKAAAMVLAALVVQLIQVLLIQQLNWLQTF
tara:strand:+ start:368 stop:589 length:222 start_codon:yes stop_codon:yes gene_type:complete